MSFDGSKYKAGDRVIVDGDLGVVLTTVQGRTADGYLVVDNQRFRNDGHLVGDRLKEGAVLLDLTRERLEAWERKEALRGMVDAFFARYRAKTGFDDLTADQLREIAATLAAKPAEGGGE